MKKYLSLLVSAILTIYSFTAQADSKAVSLKLDPRVALCAFRGLVENHLTGVLRTERVIASTSEARSARWESVKPLLDRFGKDLATDATIWFMLPDGSYYSTEAGGLVGQNLKDRPYFHRLIAGQDVLGDLVVSRSTGHRSVIVATPVVENGRVVAAVGVSVRVTLLSGLVETYTQLPDNAYFYALDSDGKIVLHRFAGRIFKRVNEVGDESLDEEFKTVMNKEQGVFNYTLKGRKMTSIFQKSAPLGWFFFIAQERK
jgi:methyl-accepting chemotaxis protein